VRAQWICFSRQQRRYRNLDAGGSLTSGGGTNYWLNNTGNVGINTSYNIGVGTISQINSMNVLGNVGLAKTSGSAYLTTTAPTGGMIVEGNVGIGTYVPNASLIVEAAM